MVTRSSRFRTPLAIRRSFLLRCAEPALVAADAFRLPFRHGAFDFGLCSSLLHHFPDAQAAALIAALRPFARRADNLGPGAAPAGVLHSAADQMVPELDSNESTRRLHVGGSRFRPRNCWTSRARQERRTYGCAGTGHGFEFPLYYPLRWREKMKTLRIIFAGWVAVAAPSLQTTAQTTPNEIKVTAKKYEFNPSAIKVKQGDHVRLIVTALDHDHGFKLEAFNIDQLLKKGEAVTIEFNADKAGTFPFECSHFCGLGHKRMKGELVVE